MKPAPFTYHDPSTIEEACSLLAEKENARPLAGGQSLIPMMNFRYVMPDHIIDLNGVAELAGIAVCNTAVTIGAMTRQRELEFSEEIAAACPLLKVALSHVGHRQTRNRGTIGGSICHFDPSAELPAVALLLDGRVTAQSTRGERTIAMSAFGRGFMTTALEPDELLTRIDLVRWLGPHGIAYEEFARRHGDFAIAAAGAVIALDGKGQISRASVVLAGVQPVPVRMTALEGAMVGARPGVELWSEVAARAGEVEAMSDAYITSEYRQHLAGVMCRRAVERACRGAVEKGTV